jgi:hypothetical protein
MVDVAKDRTRDGRGGKKGQDRKWWEQTGYKKVIKEQDKDRIERVM